MVKEHAINTRWSVVIYGNREDVLPLLEDWSLRDRYEQGLQRDQDDMGSDVSDVVVYNVSELGKVIAVIEGSRRTGKDLRYEVACSVRHVDGTVVNNFVLTEDSGWVWEY